MQISGDCEKSIARVYYPCFSKKFQNRKTRIQQKDRISWYRRIKTRTRKGCLRASFLRGRKFEGRIALAGKRYYDNEMGEKGWMENRKNFLWELKTLNSLRKITPILFSRLCHGPNTLPEWFRRQCSKAQYPHFCGFFGHNCRWGIDWWTSQEVRIKKKRSGIKRRPGKLSFCCDEHPA